MRYEGRIFRPPSEASSYILQSTVGCRHNACAFCDMYFEKTYRERSLPEILEDIDMAHRAGYRPKRVFIADGDALAMETGKLERVLSAIRERFRTCERIGIYATAEDVLEKGLDTMKTLRRMGLGIVYLGLESGDDEILKTMNKADLSEDMITAAQIVKQAGISLSVTVISGLGGRENWRSHAVETGRVLSRMDPDYVGLLTLMLSPQTQVSKWIDQGRFECLTPEEILLETQLMLENLEVSNCVFRSNHASNYVSLRARLPFEKNQAISQVRAALKASSYKPEAYRQL